MKRQLADSKNSSGNNNSIFELQQQNMKRDANKLIEEIRTNINKLKKPSNNANNIIENIETKMDDLDKRINEKKADLNEIVVINFKSTDGNVQYAVACSKKNIFAEIEEKLYQQYPEYRDTNNTFLANGSSSKSASIA